ncbi:hypothetical protein A3850_006890 [Lewinella sp. 4G2]|nr:hypothetical protein A3850_006890 [Lewinella sp. 4G2]
MLSTCGSAPEGGEVQTADFFDLKGYIAAEVERLNGQPLRVHKTITLNGETEVKILDDLDYEKDLGLFAGADINRNAWVDKYATDVQQLSGQHRITQYKALDSTLTTQFLEVEEERGQTIQLKIIRKTGTVLSKGRSEMIYRPVLGYIVTTKQENRFGDDVDAMVRVEW